MAGIWPSLLSCASIVISYGCSLQGKKGRQKEKGKSVLKIASQAMRGEDGLMEVVSKLKIHKWTMGWFSGSGALPKVENVTEVGSWSKPVLPAGINVTRLTVLEAK